MCEDHPEYPAHRTPTTVSRRTAIVRGAAVTAGAVAALAAAGPVSAAVRPVKVAPGLRIVPRDAWGADLPPKPGLVREDDVRVLLVHHTASPNSWSAVNTMRVTYATHTGQKGWSDVCYNLFVARDGTVYEGRAGSLRRPMRADATGGSQGYSQLVCLLGDYSREQPTPAAMESLVSALAWLAERSDVATRRDSTTTFASKGSDRWPAGSTVTSATIAPHRAMTFTACPGDAFAPLVDRRLMRAVNLRRAEWRTTRTEPAVRTEQQAP